MLSNGSWCKLTSVETGSLNQCLRPHSHTTCGSFCSHCSSNSSFLDKLKSKYKYIYCVAGGRVVMGYKTFYWTLKSGQWRLWRSYIELQFQSTARRAKHFSQRVVIHPKSSSAATLTAWMIAGWKGLRLAEDGFDPTSSGLWAQHASSAQLCF